MTVYTVIRTLPSVVDAAPSGLSGKEIVCIHETIEGAKECRDELAGLQGEFQREFPGLRYGVSSFELHP